MLPTPDTPAFYPEEGSRKRGLEHEEDHGPRLKTTSSSSSSSSSSCSSRLHIDNVPLELTDEQLQEVFKLCGSVFAASVNRPEGFAPRCKTASVVFDFAESAELAVTHLQGVELMSHAITIDRVPNLKSDPVVPTRRPSSVTDLEQWEFAFLTEKLSQLTTSSRLIGEIMVFAVESSSKADAIVELILVSMSLHNDAQTSHALALLYVVNDILCNAQASYLNPVTHRLLELCLAIKAKANSPLVGRLSRINFVAAVQNLFALWERRFFSLLAANTLKYVHKLQ